MRKTKSYGKQLPSQLELIGRERHAKKVLRAKFARTEGLRNLEQHLAIGLQRITDKSTMAQHLAGYMESRGIDSVEELAQRLSLGHRYQETLELLRYPSIFRSSDSLEQCYVFRSICDLEKDPATGTLRPISTERP